MTEGSAIPALRVRALRAGYADGGDIVCGIDLDQAPETILAVLGPNGSGKSTFVKAVAGLLRPRAGSIAITGREVSALSPAGRVAMGLAYVPQEANVFRGLTIRENLKLATEFLRRRAGVGPEQARSHHLARAASCPVCDVVSLARARTHDQLHQSHQRMAVGYCDARGRQLGRVIYAQPLGP